MKLRTLLLAACSAWLVCLAGSSVAQQPGPKPAQPAAPPTAKPRPRLGFLHPELDKDEIKRLIKRSRIVSEKPIRPLYRGTAVSHVAAGTALRNRVRGFIQLRGVPTGSTVVHSYLFWNLSDANEIGDNTMQVLLDGNVVVGTKTADNTDPCWGNAGNHSYWAEVTQYTDQNGGPNQDYEVTLPFPAGTSTSGQNPWDPFETQDPRVDGASLVVIYRNATTTGPIQVFAPPGDNMFFTAATYWLASPNTGPALLTIIGADGQRGVGHDDSLSNETTSFDGTQIAGPIVAASDWDGSDGLTLPQLWDTHTHIVNVANNPSQVDFTSPGDCLVPVAFVLDAQ